MCCGVHLCFDWLSNNCVCCFFSCKFRVCVENGVSLYVHLCVWEGGGGGGGQCEGEGCVCVCERERERERASVCALFCFVLFLSNIWIIVISCVLNITSNI